MSIFVGSLTSKLYTDPPHIQGTVCTLHIANTPDDLAGMIQALVLAQQHLELHHPCAEAGKVALRNSQAP